MQEGLGRHCEVHNHLPSVQGRVLVTIREEIQEAWDSGAIFYITFDPRTPGVVIPGWLLDRPEVTFAYSTRLHPPITSFCASHGDVSAVLSFDGVPHLCVVPYDAFRYPTSDNVVSLAEWRAQRGR